MLTYMKNVFFDDSFFGKLYLDQKNKEYIKKLFLSLEKNNNFVVFDVENISCNNIADVVDNTFFKVYTNKGIILLNIGFNKNDTYDVYLKKLKIGVRMILEIINNKDFYKALQININDSNIFGEKQDICKEELFEITPDKYEYILTKYDINKKF